MEALFSIEESKVPTGARIVAVGVGGGGGNMIGYMLKEHVPGIELIMANTDSQVLDQTSAATKIQLGAKLTKGLGAGMKPPNDKLLSIIDPKLGIKESFKIVDGVLARAVSGTSGVILASGENDINLDFADLKTVMSHRGLALMGVGEYKGENAAYEAIKNAIESPLLDNMSINGALGVLVHFNMHPEFPFMELSAAMDVVHESVDDSADVIFGTTTDESIPKDYIRITLVATGFEKKASIGVNNSDFENKDITLKPRVVVRSAMVANGIDEYSEDFLDVPTFMRNQRD